MRRVERRDELLSPGMRVDSESAKEKRSHSGEKGA